ncbi:DNA cytosine methyltransferase, partial [Pseudomonas aeruginosa]
TDTSGAIIGVKTPGQGTYSVADPRGQSFGKYQVTEWDGPAGTVIAASTTGQGAFAVADPRHRGPAKHSNEFRIVPWDRHAQAVTSAHGTGQCVEDPRVLSRTKGDPYLTGGHYGVGVFDQFAGAVSASARHDNGRWTVADPR